MFIFRNVFIIFKESSPLVKKHILRFSILEYQKYVSRILLYHRSRRKNNLGIDSSLKQIVL